MACVSIFGPYSKGDRRQRSCPLSCKGLVLFLHGVSRWRHLAFFIIVSSFFIIAPGSPPMVYPSRLFSLSPLAPPPPPTADLNPTVTSPAVTSREKHQWQPRRSMSRDSGPVDQFVIFLVAAKGAHALNSWHGSSTVECLGLNYLSLGGTGTLGEEEALGACKCSPA